MDGGVRHISHLHLYYVRLRTRSPHPGTSSGGCGEAHTQSTSSRGHGLTLTSRVSHPHAFARGSNTAAGLMLPSSYHLLPLPRSVQYNIPKGQKLHLQSHTTVISHYSASEIAIIEKRERETHTHTHTHSYKNTISSHINMSTADNWTEIVWLKEQLLQVLCRHVLRCRLLL